MRRDGFETERARAATECVERHRDNGDVKLGDYATKLRSAPIELRQLGLLSWTSYMMDKAMGERNKLSPRGHVFVDLMTWLANESPISRSGFLIPSNETLDVERLLRKEPGELVRRLLELSSHQIAWLEGEAAAYLEWLGRMAMAYSRTLRNETSREAPNE